LGQFKAQLNAVFKIEIFRVPKISKKNWNWIFFSIFIWRGIPKTKAKF